MLNYPLIATPSGDLQIVTDDRELKNSRVRLLLDVSPGERSLLPEYGSSLDQFASTDGLASLEAALLQQSIEQWCGSGFTVTASQIAPGRYRYKVEH